MLCEHRIFKTGIFDDSLLNCIESCTEERSFAQCLRGDIVHKLLSRGIDQNSTVLHLCQTLLADKIPCLLGQWRTKCEDIQMLSLTFMYITQQNRSICCSAESLMLLYLMKRCGIRL